MSAQSTMLEIRDFFAFLAQQTPWDEPPLDQKLVKFWFHSPRGDFVTLALQDDHSAIESCPKSFGLRPEQIVLEFSPVPDGRYFYFFAGAFRVTRVHPQHPIHPRCAEIEYDQLRAYEPFKFRIYLHFEGTPNFNNYLRKPSVLSSYGCRALVGNSLLAPPPKDPLDIVDEPWDRLRLIVDNPAMAAWRTVLDHYNGIYVIRDDSDGALYVGATFRSILHCWSNDYVRDLGKGKKLLRKGADPDKHVRTHFRWSLLRVFPSGTPRPTIHAAEKHAKRMLGSRAELLGMNAN